MVHVSQGRMMSICRRTGFHFLIIVSVVVHTVCMNCMAGDAEAMEHYKMISTV